MVQVTSRIPPRAKPEPPPRSITLRLTGEEAAALEIVLSFVGGSPTDSPRGRIDAIRNALRGEGFGHEPDKSGVDRRRSGIYFVDETGE